MEVINIRPKLMSLRATSFHGENKVASSGKEPWNIQLTQTIEVGLAVAQTPATRFRWRQLLNSGVDQDNWVLDDVAIAADDASGITFNWSPSASLSNATIAGPVATPPLTQTYAVSMIDQTTGCSYADEVTVSVGPPRCSAVAASENAWPVSAPRAGCPAPRNRKPGTSPRYRWP